MVCGLPIRSNAGQTLDSASAGCRVAGTPVLENVVPKERVRLDKDVSTEQREVSDTVPKEQIETDSGTPSR
jgi:hypothetical protein